MKKILTIVCTSASLLDDVAKYGIVGDVMAVNYAITYCPVPIKYAVSLHPDLLQRLVKERNQDGVLLFDSDKEVPLPVNTSGLFALWLSQNISTKYDEVRVLGISADNSGHFYDTEGTDRIDFKCRFPFDNEEWLPILKSWTNVRVASGNLLTLFKQINLDEVITNV